MNLFKTTLSLLLVANQLHGQVSGNVNYQSQTRLPDQTFDVNLPSDGSLTLVVKGMANVKADTYVAIFAASQVGKTSEEVNTILDGRIQQALIKIQAKPGAKAFVDMISFVPVYEYEVEKKVFSKKTYNEVPTGFELRKNIHIQYSDAAMLDEWVAILSELEIYDLVRVDYFSSQMEKVKEDLMIKASALIQEKLKRYETLLGPSGAVDKQLADGYKVQLPVEMYKSYQAYNSATLNLKKAAATNQVEKSTALYYQPVLDKEFDFVVNPVVLEPVIQVIYELKMKVSKPKTPDPAPKQYILVTPNGDLKPLIINDK